jgi:hypothetical protein
MLQVEGVSECDYGSLVCRHDDSVTLRHFPFECLSTAGNVVWEGYLRKGRDWVETDISTGRGNRTSKSCGSSDR